MATFLDSYCAHTHCPATDFSRKVFWQTLPPHAVVVAFLLGGFRARRFALDRDFIAAAGNVRSIDQLREEIRDYFLDGGNRGWLRQYAKVRISARRLKLLARVYLPESNIPAPRRPAVAIPSALP